MPKRSSLHQRPRCDLPADLALTLRPIGVVHSPYKWRDEAPRQANVGEPAEGVIVLRQGLQNTLKDLAGFDRCWVLFWFNWSRSWRQQLVPPRDRVKRGVFATRSPDRPNPIGLSAVEIVRITGCRIAIRGLDLKVPAGSSLAVFRCSTSSPTSPPTTPFRSPGPAGWRTWPARGRTTVIARGLVLVRAQHGGWSTVGN